MLPYDPFPGLEHELDSGWKVSLEDAAAAEAELEVLSDKDLEAPGGPKSTLCHFSVFVVSDCTAALSLNRNCNCFFSIVPLIRAT